MERSSILILLTSNQQTCITFTIAVCTVKTPDDGQRNCPKHVDFHFKNKFEKLVHLVGFIIRSYHDTRSRGRQIRKTCFVSTIKTQSINSATYGNVSTKLCRYMAMRNNKHRSGRM